MQVEEFAIPGVMLIKPTRHRDHRGYFSETFRADLFAKHGITDVFVQENAVQTSRKGVLRGLHFQLPPHQQGKLLRCSRGAILDVGVDIRRGSPTYGQFAAVQLSAEDGNQLWLPPGFAHGYLSLVNDCELVYKVTDYYSPECERGIAWDDPDLSIKWPLPSAEIILSDRDRRQPRLANAELSFDCL